MDKKKMYNGHLNWRERLARAVQKQKLRTDRIKNPVRYLLRDNQT